MEEDASLVSKFVVSKSLCLDGGLGVFSKVSCPAFSFVDTYPGVKVKPAKWQKIISHTSTGISHIQKVLSNKLEYVVESYDSLFVLDPTGFVIV